ncbi:MAG: DUF6049 family protein [Mycobacteriales bacterium]
MRSPVGGPRSRRVAVGLTALVLMLLPLPGPVPAAADIVPTPGPPAAGTTSESGLPVDVAVSVLEPFAPRPGTTLRLRGTLRNRGTEPLTDVRVRLRLSMSRVSTRGALARTAAQTGPLGSVLAGTEETLTGLLARGASVAFDIGAPVDGLGLTTSGVYPLAVEARGRAGSVSGLQTVGRVRSFLPFTGRGAGFTPTRLAWLWPLVAAPARGPAGEFLDDTLAAQLGRGGRLALLVAAAADQRHRLGPAGVPVTLAVDPALLEAAGEMRAGYQVRRPGGGGAVAGTAGPVAAAWLAQLRTATSGAPVLSLPYADPDVVALVRAGLGDDVSHTVQTGREITRKVLPGAAVAGGLGWAPGGLLTKPALDTLAGAGIDTFVLSEAALPLTRGLTYTPDARAVVQTVGGTVRALVTDDTLDALMATGAGGSRPGGAAGGSARLDAQRFLAETMVITLEHPNDARTVVVAPPRQWDPAPAYAGTVLAASGQVPWLRPVTVAEAAVGAAPTKARGSLSYPPSATALELSAKYLRGAKSPGSVTAVRTGLREFETVLVGGNAAAVRLDLAVFRLESAAWRRDPRRADELLASAGKALRRLKNRVRIGTAGLITLTSRSGTIPVTVVNGLSQPVRVQLVLSSNGARVTTRSPGVQTIDAGHSATVPVQTTRAVRTSGVFPVYAELYTPEGRPYADRVKLLVRSTAYGAVALGITGGAFAVLLLAVGVRLVRRARRARRRPATVS